MDASQLPEGVTLYYTDKAVHLTTNDALMTFLRQKGNGSEAFLYRLHHERPCAVQIRYAANGTSRRTGSSAVCRQASDKPLLMYGYQVCRHQRTNGLILTGSCLPCVFDDRKAHRNALIPASGIDNHRHGAPAHSRV